MTWDTRRGRTFTCGERTVTVRLLAMWAADGSPRWQIEWLPAPPPRMSLEAIAEFDVKLAAAKRLILATLEGWQ